MKTRNGFVSNSSSSSFLIMGIADVSKIVNKLNWDLEDDSFYWTENKEVIDGGYGAAYLDTVYSGSKHYVFYGSDEPYWFGVDIEDELKQNKPHDQIKQEFIDAVKRDFDITLTDAEVKLYYDYVSSE